MTMQLDTQTDLAAAALLDRDGRARWSEPSSDRIRLSTDRDVLIVEPSGSLEGGTVSALDRVLSEISTPTVLDLRHCDVADAVAFSDLDPGRWGRSAATVCVVLGSSTPSADGRTDRSMSVFHQIADALQALVLAESGYGSGWA